jgi:hypothetical protein
MSSTTSAVVILNGLLGNRKGILDVTDMARVVVKDYRLQPGPIYEGRGGAGIGKFNSLKRWTRAQAGADKLLLVGKSYGGHWCVRLLWKLAKEDLLHEFGEIRLLTVDPSFALHSLNKKTKAIPPDVAQARNLFQYGPRGGYTLGPPAENIAVKCMRHTNIEQNPQVWKALASDLCWALKSH